MRLSNILILIACFIMSSCDDGDIITIELDFDKDLALCGDAESNNYVVYDVKTNPDESLTLLFPSNNNTALIFNPNQTPFNYEFSISNAVLFNYRTYSGDPLGLICQEIPSSNVSIIDDYAASGGTVLTETIFIDDDQDGIASELEDLNNNGDFEDDDSDGDSIPNYKDDDDDGDNVKTRLEKPDPNNDGSIDDAQDSDNDNIPDYLDTDDDNDGTITRYEDENLNQNLQDDFADGSVIARFLDANANDIYINDTFNSNIYTRFISVKFVIINTDLDIINTDTIELGTYTSDVIIEN